MTSVWRTTAIWTGFTGSPGYTKFSWQTDGTATALNSCGVAMRNFFLAIQGLLQTGWSVTVQPTIEEHDMMNGSLLNATTMSGAPFGAVPGTVAPAAYAGGSGLVIAWGTSLIYNGRRVRGRTFVVPAVGCYEADGTLTSSAIATGISAGTALIAAAPGDFSIWSRKLDHTTKPPTQVAGALASVTAVSVKDAASQLRSRRN